MPEPAAEADATLTRLRPGRHADGLFSDPVYHRRGLEAACPELWLRPEVLRRLIAAARSLAGDRLGLLVLDAWRPRELQRALWERYRAELASETGLAGTELDQRAQDFVSPPDGSSPPPAHSTGGAVDITLCTLDGEPLDMGGNFDELTDRSLPDHYEREPLQDSERVYRDRRRLLHAVMSSEDFWRFPTEWWHFEYGTAAWADSRQRAPLYGEAEAPGA